MKKIFTILLIAISLCVPVFASAQEAPPVDNTEVTIPVYFFTNEDVNVLGITPISEDQFLWFYPLSEEEAQIAQEAGADVVRVNFTGHMYDDSTDLYYMGARYQNPEIGRFVSEDPVFLLVGDGNFANKWNNNWRDTKSIEPDNNYNLSKVNNKKNEIALRKYLSNPQHLNSYSYVMNNPLKYTDPNGEWELHFSFTTNAGAGAAAGNTWSAGFASDGSYGTSVSWHVGGYAGADASIGGLWVFQMLKHGAKQMVEVIMLLEAEMF